jgi:hypothetical protein
MSERPTQEMQRVNSAVIPPPANESLPHHLIRSAKNAFYACFGFLQTSKEKTLIKFREYEIEQRKKSFGVTYLNCKKQGLDDNLPASVEAALKDIAVLENEIHVLRQQVETKTQVTKSKFIAAPGSPVPTTAPTAPTTTTTTTIPPPEAALMTTTPPPPDAAGGASPPTQTDPAAPPSTTSAEVAA